MIYDLKLYRAAARLLRDHGSDAETLAVARAGYMLEQHDFSGLKAWLGIKKAVVELRQKRGQGGQMQKRAISGR